MESIAKFQHDGRQFQLQEWDRVEDGDEDHVVALYLITGGSVALASFEFDGFQFELKSSQHIDDDAIVALYKIKMERVNNYGVKDPELLARMKKAIKATGENRTPLP